MRKIEIGFNLIFLAIVSLIIVLFIFPMEYLNNSAQISPVPQSPLTPFPLDASTNLTTTSDPSTDPLVFWAQKFHM